MRCKAHRPTGRTREYVAAVRPVGYPETALICSSVGCEEPGLIWLETSEKAAYDEGQRIFQSFTNTMKVRAA